MSYSKSGLYFLLALLAVMLTLSFFIFQPFLAALILALIFSTTFSPVYKRIFIITRESQTLASLITTLLVLIVIVVPATFLSIQIFKEATQLYSSLVDSSGATTISQSIEEIIRNAGFPSLPVGALDFSQYMKGGLNLLIQNLGTIFSNLAKIMVDVFILLVALFYLFKDGNNLKKSVITLSPLKDAYDETIFRKLELAINSVVRGSIAVGLVHGVLTTIGFIILGISNPVLWGGVAVVLSLVPGVGIGLIMLPCALLLFFSGATAPAIGVFIWWILQANLVDNVLKPKIVGRGMKLHPFLILLSIFGGIGFFGPLGFLFGPLALSLLFALLETYSLVSKEHNA